MKNKWLIGVDLGGTTVKIAFLTAEGDIVDKWEIPTDHQENGKYITVHIAQSIEENLVKWGKNKLDVKGIGMGAPGPVQYETGEVIHSVNLGWHDHYPVKQLLEQETGLSVVVDNDANCAALGEMWRGAGTGAKDLVCVTLGTGVGGGVITNGQIVQGIAGAAGEIGHIVSVIEGGFACNCGKYGCLETVASATGIVRLTLEALQQPNSSSLKEIQLQEGKITAKDVFVAAEQGDLLSNEIVTKVSQYLGLALANIANTLNPQKIVIGGGVSKAGDILLKQVETNFQRFAFRSVAQSTTMTVATLGNDAGVIGAAWLAKNK